MSYIKFEKKQLINLEFSLQRELLRANGTGSYASTTLAGCNIRKYHGLLVTLQPQIDNQHHVLLSSIDETIIQQNHEFNLGLHKYAGDFYEPGGHKYIQSFEAEPVPRIVYKVGGMVLNKDRIFAFNDDRILIRYTLVNAHMPTILRFRPFLAFRNVHSLSRKNNDADTSYTPVKNGISVKMYPIYSPLFIQFSKKVDYMHDPQWYYGIEYSKEITRGYEYKEDLLVPGHFDIAIDVGETILISAGLNEIEPAKLKNLFIQEVKKITPRDSFENCLKNAAAQFFVRKNNQIEMIAGYHWFAISGRDTFVALPGLTLLDGNSDLFLKTTDTMVELMQGPFFPNNRIGNEYLYNSVDAPLWFFWALQQYLVYIKDPQVIWKKYKSVMTKILDEFSQGTLFNIYMQEDGLLHAGGENDVLTWMNVKIDDKPLINRNGLAVEINALWYNAICFFVELATEFRDKKLAGRWKKIADKVKSAFVTTFWDEEKGYLADVVRNDTKDFTIRPNQVIATSLPYSPLSDEIKHSVLHLVEAELLTPRGLRTLTPKNPDYKGVYRGNMMQRDHAYHQGSAFPWLFGQFADAYLQIHGESGLSHIKKIFAGFEEEMFIAGIGTVSELFYGDPPHRGKGAISQAWNVAELLRVNDLIKKYEQKTNKRR